MPKQIWEGGLEVSAEGWCQLCMDQCEYVSMRAVTRENISLYGEAMPVQFQCTFHTRAGAAYPWGAGTVLSKLRLLSPWTIT